MSVCLYLSVCGCLSIDVNVCFCVSRRPAHARNLKRWPLDGTFPNKTCPNAALSSNSSAASQIMADTFEDLPTPKNEGSEEYLQQTQSESVGQRCYHDTSKRNASRIHRRGSCDAPLSSSTSHKQHQIMRYDSERPPHNSEVRHHTVRRHLPLHE